MRLFLQAAGLAVVLMALSLSVIQAQRGGGGGGGDPAVHALEDKAVENRQRIVSLEVASASVATRLARIETELEISRRAAESNGQLLNGLAVGIALMLAERLFALFRTGSGRKE